MESFSHNFVLKPSYKIRLNQSLCYLKEFNKIEMRVVF